MKLTILITFTLSFLFGQENSDQKNNPCAHPLVEIAKNKGVKSIPMKDIFKYRKLIKQCKENGNEDFVKQIYLMDWERDFKKSKTMASWTSTHAMFVFASFSYYYFAKILDVPYDVTFFPKNSD